MYFGLYFSNHSGTQTQLSCVLNLTVLGKEPVLSGGIWKCGNCDGIDESKLMYSETNGIEDKMMADSSVNIQVSL